MRKAGQTKPWNNEGALRECKLGQHLHFHHENEATNAGATKAVVNAT